MSRFILDRHRDLGLFDETPVHRVIHNGYRPPANVSRAASGRSGHVRFGFLGRLEPEKGLDGVLDALEQLPPERWSLVIGGKGSDRYEQQLRERVDRLPNVSMLGWVDPAEVLNQVDVHLVPSLWHDPLPRVTFEAFAHGLPVIGTARGGITELIDPGVTGFVFEPNRPDELRACLDKFISNPGLATEMWAACPCAPRRSCPNASRRSSSTRTNRRA